MGTTEDDMEKTERTHQTNWIREDAVDIAKSCNLVF